MTAPTMDEWAQDTARPRSIDLTYRPLGHWPWVCHLRWQDSRNVGHHAHGLGRTKEEAFAQALSPDGLCPKVTPEEEAAMSAELLARSERIRG